MDLDRAQCDPAIPDHAKTNARGRAYEAERLLRECLALRLNGPDPSNWRTGNVRSCLGGALFVQTVTDPSLTSEARRAKLAEAEAMLLEGDSAMEHGKNVETRYRSDSFIRLIRLYERSNDKDKAAAWRQKLYELEEG